MQAVGRSHSDPTGLPICAAYEEDGGGLWLCMPKQRKQRAFLWDPRGPCRGSLNPPAKLACYGGARPSSLHPCYLDSVFLSGWWSSYVPFGSFTTPHLYPPITINCVFLPQGVLFIIATTLKLLNTKLFRCHIGRHIILAWQWWTAWKALLSWFFCPLMLSWRS